MTNFTPADDRVHELECSLSRLAGISEALTLLGRCLEKPQSEAFGYLTEQLYDERDNARDAFTKLFYPRSGTLSTSEGEGDVGTADGITAAPAPAPQPATAASAAAETPWQLATKMEDDVAAIEDFANILLAIGIDLDQDGNDIAAASIRRISDCIRSHAEAIAEQRSSLSRLLKPSNRDDKGFIIPDIL
jgi:hypothetical protein